MYRIHELKLRVGEEKGVLAKKIEKLIGAPVKSWKIVRESIDAREKPDIRYVYTVDFEADIAEEKNKFSRLEGQTAEEQQASFKIGRYRVELAPEVSYVYPVPGSKFVCKAEEKNEVEGSDEPGNVGVKAGKSKGLVQSVGGELGKFCDTVEGQGGKAAGSRGVRAAKMPLRPVVAGFGPCGMFAALLLAEMGYRPVVLERGKRVEDRVRDVQAFWSGAALNPESNVQFGEGGAGTFSDGKLTTQIKDRRVRKVLEEFSKAGGGEEILYKQKPHIGTDKLRVIVKNIREKIISLGGEIRFESRMSGIRLENGAVSAVEVNGGSNCGGYELETRVLITALGHSARDTFRMLYEKGLPMQQKPFSIGVRIEHPQELINAAQYGRQDIGAADYKLSYHCKNGRGVYTFCMCPGGEVIKAASQVGMTVTNGMSYSARDGRLANSGLLVDVRTSDFASEHPLAGIEFQEKYERLAFVNGGENYELPVTTWGEFEAACLEAAKAGQKNPVLASLPAFAAESICEAMPHLGKKLKGFDSPDAVMKAVETRSSSPVRILRDKDFESDIKGIFPGGEGAGYAGGIVSAACDGLRIAEEIIRRYIL